MQVGKCGELSRLRRVVGISWGNGDGVRSSEESSPRPQAVKWHKLPAEWPPCGHKSTLFCVVAHRIPSLTLSHQLKVVLARVDVRTRTDLVTLTPFTVGCD